jgi:undecaprenyl-diphosphatase
MSIDLSTLEAAAGGLLQGVASVFPISGLGHGVLIGSLDNGAGADLAPADSGYLYACLRVSVGLALLAYFWRDWVRVGRGFVGTLVRGSSGPADRRWAWLVVLAVLPSTVGVLVLAPHARSLAEHPTLAAACLAGNGLLMLGVWHWFRRSPRSGGLSGTHRAPMTRGEEAEAFAAESSTLRADRMITLGLLPLVSLVPGASGVGLAICACLLWGLTQEQAARVALLVTTPLLLAWGARDLPDLGAAKFDGVRTAVLVACGTALVAAYLTTSLLLRYFRAASLRPFGYYCLLAGGAALVWLST